MSPPAALEGSCGPQPPNASVGAVPRSAQVGLAAGVADGVDRANISGVTDGVEQPQAALGRAFPDPPSVAVLELDALRLDLRLETLVSGDGRFDAACALPLGLAGVGVV